ncbi:MAG TPA: hypothetical protein VJ375_13815 [Gaiellaceae bacterium]|jgi:hypothetical protein|nr:hypothetical protein [Gaiellaceae bacterium]
MTVWTLSLIASVTLIWFGMLGAVAYLAAQKAPARALNRRMTP